MVPAFIGSCTQASGFLLHLSVSFGRRARVPPGSERYSASHHQEAGAFAGAHTVITKALSSSASTEWQMPG